MDDQKIKVSGMVIFATCVIGSLLFGYTRKLAHEYKEQIISWGVIGTFILIGVLV